MNAALVSDKVDITLPARPFSEGRIHPISKVMEEITDIFARMAALVKAAGGSLADVVIKLNIYLTNIGNREQVWRARRESFSGVFPACTLVEVSKLAPGIDVEIEAVAVLNQGGRPAAA